MKESGLSTADGGFPDCEGRLGESMTVEGEAYSPLHDGTMFDENSFAKQSLKLHKLSMPER